MNDTIVSVEQVSKSYGRGARVLQVLNGVSFALGRGEIVCLMGESGAGKTTLMNLLGLLDSPDAGGIRFAGQEIAGFSEAERAVFRNRSIGFLFQFHYLLADFSALENVLMPGLIAGRSRAELAERGRMLLARVGLEKRAAHFPAELSGGEQQRVAMVRALMNDPLVVLADEPTGNLDERNSENFVSLAFELARETGKTFFIATHSRRLAGKCDRIFNLADGKVGLAHGV